MKISKSELVNRIVSTYGGFTKRTARDAVEIVFGAITSALSEGHDVTTPIGILRIKKQAPRNARNPKTGEIVPIPARNKLKLYPQKSVTLMINERG